MAETPERAAVARLAAFYRRNGYVRLVHSDRRAAEPERYKKGAEIRLVAETAEELAEIRVLLERAGFRLAAAFAKGRQWRQPIYGVADVARFLALIGKERSVYTSPSTLSAGVEHACPPVPCTSIP